MKTAAIVLALGAAATVSAQIPNLPTCAQGPILTAVANSGCGTNTACICSKLDLGALAGQLSTLCSPSDLAALQASAGGICGGSSAPAASPAAPAASPAGSPPASSAAAVVPSSVAYVPSSAAYVSPALSTGTGAPVPPANGTGVTPPVPSQSFVIGAAPAVAAQGTLALLVGVVAAVFAL